MADQKNLANDSWQVAELLRGDFKQSEYGLVILPFTVLRRFECVLEPTRDEVRDKAAAYRAKDWDLDALLPDVADAKFYNTSRYSLSDIGLDATLANLEDYVASFSENARAVFEQFEFAQKLQRLDDDKLLYKVASYFAGLDLHLLRSTSYISRAAAPVRCWAAGQEIGAAEFSIDSRVF